MPIPQGSSYGIPPVDRPSTGYTRDEALWFIRTNMEAYHRHMIHLFGVTLHYRAWLKNINHLPEMTISEVLDTGNKSVALYVPIGPHFSALSQVLHNYIYRRWFQPYQSEIECHRFLCKVITPPDLPYDSSPSKTTISSVVALNSVICAEVQARHQAYDELVASGQEIEGWLPEKLNDHRLHVLQPLFQALLVIVCADSYRSENSKTVGRLPVLLVRTGIEERLSAPITFESIVDKVDVGVDSGSTVRTTLETAVDFVMSLEAREAAAFGLQPDPIAAWESVSKDITRWWKEYLGDEPVVGPSSTFVDSSMCSEWGGFGEEYESRMMAMDESRVLRREAKRLSGDLVSILPNSFSNET